MANQFAPGLKVRHKLFPWITGAILDGPFYWPRKHGQTNWQLYRITTTDGKIDAIFTDDLEEAQP